MNRLVFLTNVLQFYCGVQANASLLLVAGPHLTQEGKEGNP